MAVNHHMKSTFKTFLERAAGVLLLVAALFALAAIVGFGSLGRQSPLGWAFAVLGLIALAGWLAGRLGTPGPRDKYAGQRTIMGVNAVASVLLLLAILVGVNYVSARHHRILDLTQNHINSLSGETYKVLDQLKEPLQLTYVYVPSQMQPQPSSTDQQLLNAYSNASPKIKITFLNALENPLEVQQLQLPGSTNQPILLIQPTNNKDAGKRQQVMAIDEGNITSAIMKITNPTPKVLYFLSGHGEMSPMDPSGKLGQAGAALEQQNYILKNLTLIGAHPTIPADASALVVVAPEEDLSPQEEHLLETYTNGKNHLVLLLDPPRGSASLWPNWKKLLKTLGVELQDGIVLDKKDRYSSPAYVVGQVTDVTAHPVLRSVGANNMVVLPGVMPMHLVMPAPPSLSATPLFESSDQSQSALPDQSKNSQTQPGPFVLAAAIERTESGKLAAQPKTSVTEGMRAVVVGNASFITNDVFNLFANGPFFLGAVNWAVGNDALVSIPPKEPVTNTINLTASSQNFVALFALLVLPVLSLLIGSVVWWKRR